MSRPTATIDGASARRVHSFDIVTLSKSISGFGLPMSLVLMKPELDIWQPAEHTGTFRGPQLAFVTATEALRVFDEDAYAARTADKGRIIAETFAALVAPLDPRIVTRGIGMMWGVDFTAIDATGAFAKKVSQQCFAEGLIIERVGRNDTVLKVLPPLVITPDELDSGLRTIAGAIKHQLS